MNAQVPVATPDNSNVPLVTDSVTAFHQNWTHKGGKKKGEKIMHLLIIDLWKHWTLGFTVGGKNKVTIVSRSQTIS